MPPNYVIEEKGKKSVIIRTQNQENCKLSVLLSILSNGKKLSPLLWKIRKEIEPKSKRKIKQDIYCF